VPNGYTKVGTFRDHNELALVRSMLESEGIETLSENEHMSALRIPILSGSVRLFVLDTDAQRAEAMLSVEISEDDDESLWTESLESGPEDVYGRPIPVCPDCGANDVTPSFSLAALLSFPLYVLGLSLSRRDLKHWRCQRCQQKWME
jgi:hypothetical protein